LVEDHEWRGSEAAKTLRQLIAGSANLREPEKEEKLLLEIVEETVRSPFAPQCRTIDPRFIDVFFSFL